MGRVFGPLGFRRGSLLRMTQTVFSRNVAASVAAAALLLCAVPIAAWTHVGHSAVADLAEARLTPEARKQVEVLLAVDHAKHLSEISTWADTIKKEHHPDAPAHSLRLPLNHSSDVDQTLCPSNYCAVRGLETWLKVLADKSQSPERREEALKFVVHLVGDIHQPLHAAEYTGKEQVIFNGKAQNLHLVWDMSINATRAKNHEQLAALLEKDASTHKYFTGGTPTDWALESRDIVRDEIYADGVTAGSKTVTVLPADYADKMWPIAEMRMTQAGVRLAGLLNEALR